MRYVYLVLMRDLHISPREIAELTYPQIYLFMESIKDANKAQQKELEKAKMEVMKANLRGGRFGK